MPINQTRCSSTSSGFSLEAARLSAMAFLVLSVSLSAAAASAAGDSPNANARYQADRATCNSGQSNQDRATCLKEAGAALQESRRGHLKDDPAANQRNTSLRCDALPADERDACQRRMEGEGETSGSVRDGGLIRELTVPDHK